jgi:hypothetical protein
MGGTTPRPETDPDVVYPDERVATRHAARSSGPSQGSIRDADRLTTSVNLLPLAKLKTEIIGPRAGA